MGALPSRVDRSAEQVACFQDSVTLVYGMACPLRCDFCCHAIEEYGPVKMRKEDALDWIRQAASLPSLKCLVFTGGEPFVYYQELLEILEATRPLGLPFRIVTSAYWATNLEAAKAKLAPLRERGLRELSVSTDPSHQRFVPATYAEHAVSAAVELGLVAALAGVFWNAGMKVEDVVRVPPGVKTISHLAVPVGRGSKRAVTPQEYQLGLERFKGCGRSGSYSITIYPDGEVYPCCSGGFNIQAKLSFGNLKRESLGAIVERMHADSYTRLIMSRGFLLLYELTRFKYPEVFAQLPDWSPFVSPCQLCAKVHANGGLMAALQPVLRYSDALLERLEELQAEAPQIRPEVPTG